MKDILVLWLCQTSLLPYALALLAVLLIATTVAKLSTASVTTACQRLSIAIQCGNAASLLGTPPVENDAEEFYDAIFWLGLILYLKHITICHAVDLSELDSFVSINYEEPNSNNRRGYYGDPDNVSRANQYYETAYNADRRTSQQDLGRAGGGTKFTKPANQRKPLYSESRKAYAAALGYSKTRNGDTSEIDSAMAGVSSAENDDSNGSILNEDGLTNNTAFGSVSALVKSNFPKQPQQLGMDSCTCQGSEANEEVSFLCFSSRDGSKNLSIKYKGTIIFDLEDILKGYKLYFDSMQVNIKNVLNSESNFKNEFDGDSKLTMDISKFKINGGKFNAETKFDLNKIKKGDSKFKVIFDKFDMNTIKEDSNKFNFEVTKNGDLDIQKYFNGNNKFKTQFEKNSNSNAQMEAWKKIQEMAESKKNSKFSLNNNYNSNQFSYEADAQVEIEAHAKALAKAEAIRKAQAIFQAQMETEAKAQAVLQNQITAQAHIEAQAKARAEAKAQAEAHAKTQMQLNGIGQNQVNSQSQSHAISFSDDHKGGFSLGFNGAIGATNFGTSYGKQTGGAFSFGGGTGGAIGIGGGAGGAIGTGGGAGGAIGIGGGAGGAFGIGGGAGGAIGIGRPFSGGKSMVGSNDGQSMGTVMTYTGSEFNYGDDLYDESLDDGSLSIGYPGVLAFPTPNDSPVSSGRLYDNGRIQKDGYTTFGVSGYQRYP